MNKLSYLLLLIFTSFFLSCDKDKTDFAINSEDSLYFSSFESSSEVLRNAAAYLSSDTPQGGGDSSLVVCGGCLVPHLQINIGSFDEDTTIDLEVWAKTSQQNGGSVAAYLESDPSNLIQVIVEDTEWASYESDEHLFVPANEEVILQFISGGIIAVESHFDLLRISAVE